MTEVKKKSWFARHKIATVLIALVLIIIIVSASSGDKSDTNGSSGSQSSGKTKEYRFADRADKQDKDIELVPAEAGTIDGVKMVVNSAETKTSVGEFSNAPTGKAFVVVNVTIENTSDRAQPYNAYNFRVQTSGGQVLDPTFESVNPMLNSGDVVQGGKVTGNVVFEVPVEEGHQYIIWKPGFGSDRAIIQVK